ncbi:hypothetical protein MNB_SV-12-1760 [hydrothermal vent metagenome]|uniref:Uncharacterized protein n=1 Tax=hydrothermal vent metagenome TaxID=652676 RepID=A0A1W1CAP2_9ZZZZ
MQKLRVNQNFSNIQLELLKLYATNIQDNELLDIKNYLAKYFAQKAVSRADAIWDAKNFDNNKMDEWLNEK